MVLLEVTLQVWGLHSCVTSHHAANSWAPTPLNTPTTRQISLKSAAEELFEIRSQFSLTRIIVSNEREGTINQVNGQIIQTRAVKLHTSSRSQHSDSTAAILSSSASIYYLLSALQPPSIYFWTGVRTWLTARLQAARKNNISIVPFILLCSRIGTNQTRKDQC